MARVGRPTRYRKSFCKDLIEHFKLGFSFETFGARVHCSKDTLYQWLKKHPEFADAKNIGLMYSMAYWEGLGIQAITGRNANFNNACWIFNMKNRFGWRDKQADDGIDDTFEPIIIELPESGRTLQIENKKG